MEGAGPASSFLLFRSQIAGLSDARSQKKSCLSYPSREILTSELLNEVKSQESGTSDLSNMSTYGLIGKTLTHSFSKKYFTEKFADAGITSRYELFELPEISAFPELLSSNPDLRGLNVTIPYKESILPYLDSLSPAAQEIGAVNTIKFTASGLVGHNTDAPGFEQSLLASWEGAMPEGALILGTGGASKAVDYVLSQRLGIPRVLKVSRKPTGNRQCSYEDARGLDWDSFRLIVNTTPLGTYPEVDGKPSLPYQLFSSRHLAFDLVYNPPESAYLAEAKGFGARTKNGSRMPSSA